MSIKPTFRKPIPDSDYISCRICYDDNKIDIVRCERCENDVCFSCYRDIKSKKCPYCRTLYNECNRYSKNEQDKWVKKTKVTRYIRERYRPILIAHRQDRKEWFSDIEVSKIIEILSETLEEDHTLFNEKLKILEMRDYHLYIEIFKNIFKKNPVE